jgi:hypothetical protein
VNHHHLDLEEELLEECFHYLLVEVYEELQNLLHHLNHHFLMVM